MYPQPQRRKVPVFRQSYSSPSFTAFLFATINLAVFVTTVDPQRPGEQIMELYMHDILRGDNQTARPITGLLGNIYSGPSPLRESSRFQTSKGWCSHSQCQWCYSNSQYQCCSTRNRISRHVICWRKQEYSD